MQREALKYLHDIRESIGSIEDYLGEQRDFNRYSSDKMLRRAVERELEIIGEAVNRLLKLDEHLLFKEARRIVDLRNFVIHGYDKVDDVIIWGIIIKDIPRLKSEIDRLLG
jgi:uncharacterized protein with HEPN domain